MDLHKSSGAQCETGGFGGCSMGVGALGSAGADGDTAFCS